MLRRSEPCEARRGHPARLTLLWPPWRYHCQCSPPTALGQLRGGGSGACTRRTDQRGRVIRGGHLIEPHARRPPSNERSKKKVGNDPGGKPVPGLSKSRLPSLPRYGNRRKLSANFRRFPSGAGRASSGNSVIRTQLRSKATDDKRGIWREPFAYSGYCGHILSTNPVLTSRGKRVTR